MWQHHNIVKSPRYKNQTTIQAQEENQSNLQYRQITGDYL